MLLLNFFYWWTSGRITTITFFGENFVWKYFCFRNFLSSSFASYIAKIKIYFIQRQRNKEFSSTVYSVNCQREFTVAGLKSAKPRVPVACNNWVCWLLTEVLKLPQWNTWRLHLTINVLRHGIWQCLSRGIWGMLKSPATGQW